ncbi:hypothetical protein [Pedobacter agri]|uniref:hypothetical protein n=1 Tax=Pedobacter agri TaxID=454586 RepID=UPI00292F21D3|nr:hypothetical protein [Pedobacter agri]
MKKFLFSLIFGLVCLAGNAQIKYTGKVEIGRQIFLSRPIRVDPGPGWRGYQLNNNQSGLDLSIINGISFKNNLRLGFGVGYLNYEGINGYSFFGDLEFATSKDKVSPLFNLKIGQSHINNQYDNGSTDSFVDFGAGIEYRISKKIGLQVKAGFRFVHQSIFLPIRIGARF